MTHPWEEPCPRIQRSLTDILASVWRYLSEEARNTAGAQHETIEPSLAPLELVNDEIRSRLGWWVG